MFNIAEVSGNWAKQENIEHTVLSSIESTSDYAKNNLSSFENKPHLVFTSEQTMGRGRGSNTWVSSKDGEALLCSFVFQLEKAPQPIAAPCFGWAVYRALNESFDLEFSVKAPNDIYIGKNKIGGILLESVSQGDSHHLILGLGINVFSHPNIENSSSVLNFIESNEIEENQWEQFLSHLLSLSSQAAIAAQDNEISKVIISELETALKKYDNNQIETLLANGGLKLSDGSTTNWREL
ncbi:MAG: biotin--[acetyl-CoA-carboxylase] ligase [Bdellovibrionales bacterium]